MTDEKNPYSDMPVDVLQKHLEQLKTVVTEKKINVTQFFGEPIKTEDKEKLEKYDSLQSKVDELSKKASKENLTDNESKLADATVNRIVSDIKKIDKDAPIEGVLKSNFNNLQKIEILNETQGIVQHYTGQMDTLRTELGNQPGTPGTQTFSKPTGGSETAAELIKSMLPEEKK